MATRDIVIIGSGFGAAVMAARLGQHLKDGGSSASLLVIEKGLDHTGQFDPFEGDELNAQGNRFKHSLAPEYLATVAELFTDVAGVYRPGTPSMQVAAGTGFGGGSNVYCGVSLRAPRETFDQAREGRRLWPSEYNRLNLNPYYDLVSERLRVRQMQWTDATAPHWALCTKRDYVFAEGCRRIGATAVPLRLATHNDTNEGWWTQGQRFEGRQSLNKNYLLLARDAGVEFWSQSEVEDVAPDGGGYVVRGIDRRGGSEKSFEVECKLLIVAAGCIGSTGILLRSQDNFAGPRALDQGREELDRPVLGQHLSGNGDYGAMGIVGPSYEFDVEGYKGKPMSSFTPSFWKQHQFILIPFYAEPLYPAQGQFSTLLPAQNPAAAGRGSTTLKRGSDGKEVPDWGQGYKDRLSYFGSRMMTMGCLALDQNEGEVILDENSEKPRVLWKETSPATEARWSAAIGAMRSIYEALGGELFLDSYRKDGTVYTAHPLGAARMADTATQGVVNSNGESFGNRNLFVVDGSILPAALGVNPSLTIAAVAERIADRLIRGIGVEALSSRV